MRKPTIAISAGDPAGIGPEVVLKSLADPDLAELANWIVVADRIAIEEARETTGIPLAYSAALRDIHALEGGHFHWGRLAPESGRAALTYIRTATELCLSGEADAMVTGPVNKEAISLSGQPFSGHTEYIAELCGVKESRMLLVGPRLRVVHVTTHVALRQACLSTVDRVRRTIELGHQAVRLLGIADPRIGVCGLNPHAGEHGLFGKEEEEIVEPAIKAAAERGIRCEGPVPADTIFLKAARGGYDLVVAMYHDQGHIPVKLLDFEETVNVSLGLPIIRTSVDHGTAFDIAGRNLADARSMKAALRLAVTMATHRERR